MDSTGRLNIFFCALQENRDILVLTFCDGVHIPAAVMSQTVREQQLCRFEKSLACFIGECKTVERRLVSMRAFYSASLCVCLCVSDIGFHHRNSDHSGMLSPSVCVQLCLAAIGWLCFCPASLLP